MPQSYLQQIQNNEIATLCNTRAFMVLSVSIAIFLNEMKEFSVTDQHLRHPLKLLSKHQFNSATRVRISFVGVSTIDFAALPHRIPGNTKEYMNLKF